MRTKQICAGMLGLLLLCGWNGERAWAGEKEKLTAEEFGALLGALMRDPTPRYIGQGSGKILIVPVKKKLRRTFVAASLPALLIAVGSIYREKLADIDSLEASGDLWRVEAAQADGPEQVEMAAYGISLQKSWVEILTGQNKGHVGWMLNAFLDMERRQFRPIQGMELKGLAQFEPQDDYQKAEELRREILQHRLR